MQLPCLFYCQWVIQCSCLVYFIINELYNAATLFILLSMSYTMQLPCLTCFRNVGGGWMIFHYSIVLVYFFSQLNFTVIFPDLLKYYTYSIYYYLFRFGSDLRFLLLSFPRDQSRDVTPRLGEGGLFFIFNCSCPFCFLLTEIYYYFSISYIVLTCYVYYYYSIW